MVIDSRLSAKNVKLARPTLFNYIYTREEFEHYANELFEMMSKDKMNVRIHEIYTLEEVARAHNVSDDNPRPLLLLYLLLTKVYRISRAGKLQESSC